MGSNLCPRPEPQLTDQEIADQDLARVEAEANEAEAAELNREYLEDKEDLKEFHTEVSRKHAETAKDLAWTAGAIAVAGAPGLGALVAAAAWYEDRLATEHANAATDGESGPWW